MLEINRYLIIYLKLIIVKFLTIPLETLGLKILAFD